MTLTENITIEDLKADPSLVAKLADILPYPDAVALTYRLPNPLRKALIDRYRKGLSKRPGYVVMAYYRGNKAITKFIDGATSEEEAKSHINTKGENRRYRPLKIVAKKTGVWPKPV